MAYTFLCQRDRFKNEACVITIYDLLEKNAEYFLKKHVFKEKHRPTQLRDLTSKKNCLAQMLGSSCNLVKIDL